jgi:hypothetical protein
MQLDARIHAIAEDLGADFYGVADLAPALDFILWQGWKRAIRAGT